MSPGDAEPEGPAPPRLVRTVVRLKLRLLRNQSRRSAVAGVTLAVALVGAVVLGALLALAVAYGARYGSDRLGRAVLVVGATAIVAVWALFPLVWFGSDETVDPGRLVLFPLRGRQLVGPLTAAAFVGAAPVFAVVAVLGAVVGFGAAGGWTAVPAAALLLLLAVVTARTLSTVLAGALRSRRGRDTAVILGSLLGLSLQGLRFIPYNQIDPALVDRAAEVLRWLPPGMLGQSVIDARAGRPLVAVAELVPAAVLVVLLRRVWARALDRALTGVDDASGGRRRTAPATALPLLFRRLPLVPARAWGAVAAKELRYVGRDPRRKVVLVNSLVIGLGVTVWTGLSRDGDARTVLVATAAGFIAVLNSGNQLGLDGAARWIDVVAGDTARATFVGKNVATVLVVLPLVAVTSTVAAVITDGWLYLPAAVLLAGAALAVGLGTGNVVSAYVPVRLPDTQNPFAGRAGGQGCATGLLMLACVFVQNLLLAPVVGVALAAALAGPGWLLLAVPLALGYGTVVWRAGTGIAARRLAGHQPEVLAVVDPVRGA